MFDMCVCDGCSFCQRETASNIVDRMIDVLRIIANNGESNAKAHS